MTAVLTRRSFVRSAALAAVGAPLYAAVRPRGAGAADPRDTPWFTHGVASGDPTLDGVVLWTRVAPMGGPDTVQWRLASDPDLTRIVASGEAPVDPSTDGTVQVTVEGLRPGTTYWYEFSADGDDSATGRTRTLPGPGARATRFAVLSCGNLETGWFNAYTRVAERDDLDLVVHLGDYLYEYGDVPDAATPLPGRRHAPRIELRSLGDYRLRYAQYRADPDLQALHRRHPVVALWDDHEVADDSWATGARAHGPDEGPYEPRRVAATRAWHEWHPRADARAEPWRAIALGSLVDASLVDGRSHRPHVGDPGHAGGPDDGLGATQRRWLEHRLARPAGRWPVVLTQQPVMPRYEPDGSPTGVAGWSGFPAAQASLLDAVRRSRAVVVSGDVHSSWLLAAEGAVEAVVPSVSSRSFGDRHGTSETARHQQDLRVANPAVSWLDLHHHGYLIVDADQDRCRLEWWFVDTVSERAGGHHLAHVHEIPAT